MLICAICKKHCGKPPGVTEFFVYEDKSLQRVLMTACWKCADAAEETVGRGGSGYGLDIHPNVYDVLREMLKLTQGAKLEALLAAPGNGPTVITE